MYSLAVVQSMNQYMMVVLDEVILNIHFPKEAHVSKVCAHESLFELLLHMYRKRYQLIYGDIY